MRWEFDPVMRIDALRVWTRASMTGRLSVAALRASLLQQGAESSLSHLIVGREFDAVRSEETEEDLVGDLPQVSAEIGFHEISSSILKVVHLHALARQGVLVDPVSGGDSSHPVENGPLGTKVGLKDFRRLQATKIKGLVGDRPKGFSGEVVPSQTCKMFDNHDNLSARRPDVLDQVSQHLWWRFPSGVELVRSSLPQIVEFGATVSLREVFGFYEVLSHVA